MVLYEEFDTLSLFSFQGILTPELTSGDPALIIVAPLAQLVEQLTLNQWVPGSNP